MKKETTIIIRGSLNVVNYASVSKENLLKIEEIKDRYGNQVFKMNTETGVITMANETITMDTRKNPYKECFYKPFHRLLDICDPVSLENTRHKSYYDNNITTPDITETLCIDGKLYVNCNNTVIPIVVENSKHKYDNEVKKWSEEEKLKDKERLKKYWPIAIILSPILAVYFVFAGLIAIPLGFVIKLSERKQNQAKNERDTRIKTARTLTM